MQVINSANSSAVNLITRMYGLPAGKYSLKYKVKGTTTGASIRVYPVKNGTRLNAHETALDNYSITTEWVEKEIEITIPEPHQNEIDYTNPASVCCQGCEDNCCAIEVIIFLPAGKDCYFKEPSLYAML
jgi:hypothetical protein